MNEGPRKQASRGARGHAPPVMFWDFKSLKFPFPGFCLMPGNWKKKTFVQTIFESPIIIIKNMFIMKNLTDLRKRWKPVWIRPCKHYFKR